MKGFWEKKMATLREISVPSVTQELILQHLSKIKGLTDGIISEYQWLTSFHYLSIYISQFLIKFPLLPLVS